MEKKYLVFEFNEQNTFYAEVKAYGINPGYHEGYIPDLQNAAVYFCNKEELPAYAQKTSGWNLKDQATNIFSWVLNYMDAAMNYAVVKSTPWDCDDITFDLLFRKARSVVSVLEDAEDNMRVFGSVIEDKYYEAREAWNKICGFLQLSSTVKDAVNNTTFREFMQTPVDIQEHAFEVYDNDVRSWIIMATAGLANDFAKLTKVLMMTTFAEY